MSPRKIIFLVVSSILVIGSIFWIWWYSKYAQTQKATLISNLSIWVVWGTTEQYKTVFSSIGKYNKEFEKTNFDIRVFPDYAQYQRILLTTLADGNGPDIFMVDEGWDDILSEKVEPIPGSIVNLDHFDKRYEDIFLPLVTSTGSKETLETFIQWVPLGYETLWIFYNKSLIRKVPKTWSELDLLYKDGTAPGVFPSNIWLSSRYTPSSIDILSLFLWQWGITGYDSNTQGKGGPVYTDYATTPIAIGERSSENVDSESINQDVSSTQEQTLENMKPKMDEGKLTTIDLFMRGKIAFVIGYPSLIEEIEKAQKRAGNEAVDALILSEHIPNISVGETPMNVAHYRYLWISKKAKNPIPAAKLLAYLTTDEWLTKAQEAFPRYISPLRILSEKQADTSLSDVFARVKMDAFLPLQWEKLLIFHFWLRNEYEKLFTDAIDKKNKSDINTILKDISHSISCELSNIASNSISSGCMESQ